MSKLFLLAAALLINLGLFTLMYYLVAVEKPIDTHVLPALTLQYVELPNEEPLTDSADSLPSLPEMPAAPPLPPVVATPLPTLPEWAELPALPDMALPALAQTLPELALESQPYLGKISTPEVPPITTQSSASSAQAPAITSQAVVTDAPQVPAKPRIVPADRNLVPLHKRKPSYPRLARRRGIEGRVEVEFLINPQGRVEEETVIFSQPQGVFDEAALQAVRQWTFAPRYIEGSPVYQRARQMMDFQLK